MIDQHTIDTLEYSKVIASVAGKCLTPYGRIEVDRIEPMADNDQVRLRLTETSQMKDIINFGDSFPLYRIEDDCSHLLERSSTEGIFLAPKEILTVLDLVVTCIHLHDYAPDERDNFPAIADYLNRLRAFPELRQEILRAIDEDGEVRDTASPQLKSIRLNLIDTRAKIVSRLQVILAGKVKQSGWQDDVVTMRNDRYVIPIPSGRYDSHAGILHDRSQSGATLYIEPKETVELNNRINLLMQEERLEIDRILRALTAEIGQRAGALNENINIIGQLDRTHASAQFSNQISGQQPQIISDSSIHLIDARHPLLIQQFRDIKKVVPITVTLGKDHQVILVTGPNTGGKTVTLKAIGLCVLMARSGLHIPADEKSEIGFFRQVHADIGDEQSIELSLSTFSSHLKNIRRGLEAAAPDSLLLFDEIGAGTDPKEGSALAEAIILYAVEKGARMVASTHYSALKTLAMEHPEIENASLEFDRASLAPTYKLHIGLPGSSYAVEIAGRLGLPREVCEYAARLTGSDERSLDDLVAQLETDLTQLKIDRKELTERLARTKELETHYRKESEQLRKDVSEHKEKALADTEQFVHDTRRQVEKLVEEIRNSQASQESLRAFHQDFSKRQSELAKRKKTKKGEPLDHTSFAPGDAVRVISFDRVGEIDKLIGSNRARVKIGNVTTTVELRNLNKVEADGTPSAKRSLPTAEVESQMSPEIHLLGMTGEEAMEALERYLDHAVMNGLHQVYVVHGKGTGALRRILTEYLQKHPEVDSLRLGNWNEGGAGVTVAKLRQ
jgi:DNA mismatch repair protein MutS2